MCTVVAVDLVITAHSGLKIGRKVQWIINYFLCQIEKKVFFFFLDSNDVLGIQNDPFFRNTLCT